MNKRILAAGLLIGAAMGAVPAWAQQASAPAVTAQAPALSSLEAAFEEAERGNLAPLEAMAPGALGDEAVLTRARLASARGQGARDPALARLADAADPATRQAALSILASAGFAEGDYGAAARWGRALTETLRARGRAEQAGEGARATGLAELLAGRPGQTIEDAIAPGTIPTRLDKVGLPRIDLNINGQAQEAVFDTGANLSVLSAETARRLAVTMLEGAGAVGNSTDSAVAVRLGIADRVEIAGTVLRNVVFLIIDDSNLSFPQVPGGYDIKAILGLPVMRALGRVRVESAAGRFTVLAPESATAGAPNMNLSGNSLFVAATVAGEPVPLHLDTGANQSSLTALYAETHRDRVAGLATSQAGAAGAGGVTIRRFATWQNAPLGIAGRALVLPSLPVTLPAEGGRRQDRYGVLGSNALRAFESYTLDFAAMRLELGEPLRAAAATGN